MSIQQHPVKVPWLKQITIRAPDISHYLLALAKSYGGYVEVNPFRKSILITDPDGIEHVLKKNMDNYTKDFAEYKRLGLLLGKGLLTTTGPQWMEKRRVIQGFLSTSHLASLSDYTRQYTEEMLNRWEWFERYDQPLNVVPDMLSLVLRISIKFLFSEDISNQEASNYVHHFVTAQRSMLRAFILKPWLPTAKSLSFYWNRHRLARFANQLIEKRKKQHNKPHDLLSVLIDNEVPLLLDEIMTFMATGHETTGNALAWALYCLGKNPVVLERLIEEEKQQPVSDYCHRVVQEVLRLYPTVWTFGRVAEKADTICGYEIPAGARIIISPFVLHHLPHLWENPEEFNPDRFLKENPARYSYIPFGMGPHICIAHTFSFLKLKLILSMIVQRYHLELLPESHSLKLEPLISLRPAKPLRFRLSERRA